MKIPTMIFMVGILAVQGAMAQAIVDSDGSLGEAIQNECPDFGMLVLVGALDWHPEQDRARDFEQRVRESDPSAGIDFDAARAFIAANRNAEEVTLGNRCQNIYLGVVANSWSVTHDGRNFTSSPLMNTLNEMCSGIVEFKKIEGGVNRTLIEASNDQERATPEILDGLSYVRQVAEKYDETGHITVARGAGGDELEAQCGEVAEGMLHAGANGLGVMLAIGLSESVNQFLDGVRERLLLRKR